MTLARILARLRDSVGDGSIDEYHVRFFVGDVRAVVERLAACERVVAAARVLFERNEVAEYEGRIEGVMHVSLDDFNAVRDALAALDGKE